MLAQFVAAGPEGLRPVAGRDGADPAGTIKVDRPGLVVVGYRSRHSVVDLKPEAFDAYLAEEGLDRVAAVRATRKPPDGVVRELFSRCAKTLLLAGSKGAAGHDRLLGFTLELVPEKNPYNMQAGSTLPLRLLYEGRPLKVRARATQDGRVSLRLAREGVWLIKAVHMIPAAAASGAQWESLWASLTFELPRTAAARPVNKRAR